jgi:hypothetical protein
MSKIVRISGFGLLLTLIAVQFVRSPRNTGVAEGPSSIVATHQVPAEVRGILSRACYDCHSNSTKYPWYAAVQPAGWWLNRHVTQGRAELNLSEFAAYSRKRAVRKLNQMADEVRERHMPLKSYRLLHGEAKLTDADIALVSNWAEDLANAIESR